MLTELHIQDFAIIDRLDLKFGAGFIVFTGETGAGKSIIIDAVEMLLGGRGESTLIRTDAAAAVIEGTFRLETQAGSVAREILEREGLLDEPGAVVLGREIRREGRNICRINGRTVGLAVLREVGELLVDVHGQSEHLSLLRVREHLWLLDRFAQVEGERAEFGVLYGRLSGVRRELDDLRQRERDAARQVEMLNFQVNEIESAALKPGELSELVEERTRLGNAEQLAALTDQAVAALDEGRETGEPSASDLLGQAAAALQSLAKIDVSRDTDGAEAQALLEQAGDLSRRLRLYRESVEFNPRRLDEVEERIGLIRSLERKYGGSVEAVMAHAEKARQELETITHAEERIRVLESDEATVLSALGVIGSRLSQARRKAGERLGKAIEAELADLRMSGARFGIDLRWEDDPAGAAVDDRRVAFGPGGLDRVEFLVAPNPGEGLKPLAKIASGGETSRLMLGLKGVLARADRTPTLIFDEIDQGIGGRVGGVVGEKLWLLARNHQVLCITHLPQLASFGDQHFKVEKEIRKGRTVTTVRDLADEARVPELALMLGTASEATMESAVDLLLQAAERKKQGRQAH
ncbi:MAG: DNA repair protein RecN [Chloroflexi bacterium RBG_13_68_17]|nr:MAG: DNA repair protein RecN [Chloroflexi bacterium RBG_13_68_17]